MNSAITLASYQIHLLFSFISISNLISKVGVDRMFGGTGTNYLFREKGSFVAVSIIAFFIFIFFDTILCIYWRSKHQLKLQELPG
jgi:hypothetical protein